MELACENEEVEMWTHTCIGARGSSSPLAFTWWTGVDGADSTAGTSMTSRRDGTTQEPGTGMTSTFTSGGNCCQRALERRESGEHRAVS